MISFSSKRRYEVRRIQLSSLEGSHQDADPNRLGSLAFNKGGFAGGLSIFVPLVATALLAFALKAIAK